MGMQFGSFGAARLASPAGENGSLLAYLAGVQHHLVGLEQLRPCGFFFRVEVPRVVRTFPAFLSEALGTGDFSAFAASHKLIACSRCSSARGAEVAAFQPLRGFARFMARASTSSL